MNIQPQPQAIATPSGPQFGSILASQPLLLPRIFVGVGNPNYNGSSTPLLAGNGKYQSDTSGNLYCATSANAGSGYAVNDVLTLSGGTAASGGAAAQINVLAVTPAGAISNFVFSVVGQYAAYPTLGTPAGTTGGAGSGATFNILPPPPDLYWDSSGQTMYVCTLAGTNLTSTWKPLSSIQAFQVQDDLGSCLQCLAYNPATMTTGATIYVAKKQSIRGEPGIGQTAIMNGVTYTMSFTLTADAGYPLSSLMHYLSRNVSGTDGSFEVDYITPPFLTGDIIYAVSIPPETLDTHACYWLEITGREWGQKIS